MDTTHDTVNKQMIHTFGNGCQLITDSRTKTAYLMNGSKTIDKYDTSNMLVSEYEVIVFSLAETNKK